MGLKRMFFDIETSYMEVTKIFRIGEQYIRADQIKKHSAIICVCWKFEGSEKIHSLKWDKGCDKDLIYKFVDIMNDCDEVVGHNGDNFDIKWIRTRALKHGIISMPDIKSIDTLKISRSKLKLPSNKLDEIAKYFGLGKKIEHRGMPMWEEVIEDNSRKAMKEMVDYCKMDVELLEKIFLLLEGFAKPKTHAGMFMGADNCSCPYCGSEKTHYKQSRVSSNGTIKCQMKCYECDKYFMVSLKAYNTRTKNKKSRRGRI